MKKGTIIVAGIFLALSIVIIALSAMLPGGRNGIPGSGFWPIIISIIMLLSSVSIIINALKMSKEDDTSLNMLSKDSIRVYITMIALVLYLILMYILGFLSSSIIMLYVFISYFSKYKWFISLLISILAASAIYLIFRYVLKVPFSFGLLV